VPCPTKTQTEGRNLFKAYFIVLKLKFPRSSKAKAISLALEPHIGVTSLVAFWEESEEPLKKFSKRIK